jgi:DNA-binding transcriptional regulator YiaG
MILSAKKKARIEAMGGRVTTAEDWLDLTAEEVALLDMKIRLGELLKAQRVRRKLSQERAAKILQTSQGRVSKLEKGQATLDQLARSLLAMGGSTKEVARAIAG